MFARFAAAVLLLATGAASAQGVDERIRIAVGPVLPPLLTLDDSGTPDGFVVDLFAAAAEEMGRTAEFLLIENVDGWAKLDSDAADLAVPLDPISELPGFEFEHVQFLEIPLRTFERKPNANGIQRPDAVIGVRSHSEAHRFAETKHFHHVEAFPSLEETFDALADGQVDGVIENEYVGLAAMHARGYTRIWAESERMHTGDHEYRIAHSPAAAELAHQFQHALDTLPASGAHTRIWNEWFGPYHRKELPVSTFIAIGLAFLSAILLLLLVALRSHYRARAEVEEQRIKATADQKRLLDVIEGAEAIAWESTLDGHVTYVSEFAVTLLGYPREAWTGSPTFWQDVLLHPEDRDTIVEKCAAAARCGEDQVLDYRVVSQSGRVHWLHDFARVIRDVTGQPVGMRGMMIEITDRMEAEAKAERRQARLAAVLDTSPVGMFRTDVHGIPTYANPRTFEILGQSEDEAAGDGWRDAVHPEDRATGRVAWEKAVRTRSSLDIEVRYARPADGKTVWVICRMDPQRDRDGEVVGFVGTITDITAQKEAEFQLSEEQRKLDTILRASPVGIIRLDTEGHITFGNERAEELTGIQGEGIDLETWLRIIHPDDIEPVADTWRCILSQHTAASIEHRVVRPDGEVLWVLGQGEPEFDESGGFVGVIGTLTDITERRKKSEQLEAHIAFDRAVATMAARLAAGDEAAIESIVQEGLAAIGPALGVERVGIHQAKISGDRRMSVVWTDCEDATTYVDESDTLSHWPWVAMEMVAGRDVILHDASALPLEAEVDRATFKSRGLKGFVFLVIKREADFIGGITAATETGRVEWTDELLQQLRFVGNTISNAIWRYWALQDQRETQERFDRAVLGSLDGYWDWPDVDNLEEMWWSPRFFELLGLEPDAFTPSAHRFFERVHPDDIDRLQEIMGKLTSHAWTGDKAFRHEYRLRVANGEYRWFVSQSMIFEDSRRMGLSGSIRDVTDRRRAEEELKLTQRTIDANAVPTFWIDAKGSFVYANSAAHRVLRYPQHALISKKAWDVNPSVSAADWPKRFEEVRQAGSMRMESSHRRADGTVIPVEINASFIEYDGTALLCMFARDITQRKRQEQEILRSEQRFRSIAENALVGVAIVDTDGFLYINDTGARLFGRSREELMSFKKGEYIEACYPEDERAEVFQLRKTSLESNDPLSITRDVRIRRPDGEIRWMSMHQGPIELQTGRAVIIVAVDITERRETEDALRESEQRLRGILDSMASFVGIYGTDGELVDCNKAPLAAASLRREDVIGKPFWETYWWSHSETEQRRIRETLERAARGETTRGDFSVRIGDEETVVIEAAFGPVYGTDGSITQLVGSGVDITNRIRTEEELRRREELLRRTERIAHVGGWELDVKTEKVFWTDEVKHIHEVPLDYEPTLDAAIAFYAPEYVEEIGELVQRAIDHRESWTVEQELITAKGCRIWVRSTGEPVIENGEVVRLQGAFQDISERKRAEQERIDFESQVQQAQKLESLGVLAGGIAHDFNNLLVSILGHADLALEEVGDNEPLAESIHQIETAARRAADLAKQMLAYSGKGRFNTTSVDLTAMTREIAELLAVSVSKSAMLQYDLEDNLPSIQADAPQIQQVVMNLITNASDALDGNAGVISLRTGTCNAEDIHSDDYLVYDAKPMGRYAFLEVTDTGCGMDEDTRTRIFDPFFTTKFAGRGLGLAAVLGIVRGHGGALSVRSQPGKGTTFRVLFPVVDVATPRTTSTSPIADVKAVGGILVVDDERSVRELAERALTRFGHTVFVASDGEEGLGMFAEHDAEIDVALLDLTMPVMGGEATFQQLRSLRPDLPVLIMSGYSESEVVDRFQQGSGPVAFIQKPFQLQALREQINSLLQSSVQVPK